MTTTFDPADLLKPSAEQAAFYLEDARCGLRCMALRIRNGAIWDRETLLHVASDLHSVTWNDHGDRAWVARVASGYLKLAQEDLAGAYHDFCHACDLDGAALIYPEAA